MTGRSLHKLESYVCAVNVSVAFVVKPDPASIVSHATILSALTETAALIPVLTCAIGGDGATLVQGPSSLSDVLLYSTDPHPLPAATDVPALLVEEARRSTDVHTHLFILKAVQYTDGILFFLVVNHSVTDGSSVFSIVHTLLRCLALEVESSTESVPCSPIQRDLVGELLGDPRCHESVHDALEPNSPEAMLKFPALTRQNVDAVSGGCLRVVYRELSAEATSAVLAQCRQHGVGFQSLLTSVATLSLLKLLEASGGLDEAAWALPIGQVVPVNMRRYLTSSPGQQNADLVTAMASVSLPWTTPALQGPAALAERPFWSGFVRPAAHQPMHEALRSPYLHRSLQRGEEGAPPHGSVAYSLVTTSVGNISVLQREYGGGIALEDVFMQAGFYADSESSYAHPAVPPSLIDSGSCGHAWVHAYSIFGRLKLTGEYYAYSSECITPYFDEIVTMLNKIGSLPIESSTATGGDALTVGNLIQFQ